MKNNNSKINNLHEITINDLFVKRVIDKAGLDLKKFPIQKIIKGFETEMELHMMMGLDAVDTINVVYDNLSNNLNYYDDIRDLNKKKQLQKEIRDHENDDDICPKLIIKKGVDNFDEAKIELTKKFIVFVCNELEVDKNCKIYFSPKRNKHLQTTASYNPNNDNIWIYVKNRNMLGDILRSLAHELMHLKQNMKGELHSESGKDGSPHENEANSFSGTMIRKFGKMYPEIYI